MPAVSTPPPLSAELPLTVHWVMVTVPASLRIPPPPEGAEFPLTTVPARLMVPNQLNRPPPPNLPVADLLVTVQLVSVAVPWIKRPPPLPLNPVAELPV